MDNKNPTCRGNQGLSAGYPEPCCLHNKKTLGVYIHIPFCASKCGYCDFYSLSGVLGKADEYVGALIKNIEQQADKSYIVDTVFVGGGTPSLLSGGHFLRIFESLRRFFNVSENAEITVECNPDSVNAELFIALKDCGVNRLSFGVQSLDDKILKALGRRHTARCAVEKIMSASYMGFDNISADIMYAVPGMSIENLQKTLEKLTGLPITHLSAYALKVERGTPFYELYGEYDDEVNEEEMYYLVHTLLTDKGYNHYEISNYAKNGKICKHNSKYWALEDYIGFGCGAHSFAGGLRYSYDKNLHKYLKFDFSKVTEQDRGCIDEEIMLRLRTCEGIELSKIKNKDERIKKLILQGLAVVRDDKFILTEKGFLLSNSIILWLIS